MPYEEEILEYISGNKATHIGLTCGIFLSFYLSSFFYIQNRLKRGLIFILMFFNFYTIIIAGERSLWVALFFMLLVSCFIGEKRFLKFKVVVIMTLAVFTLAEWLYLDKALHGTDRMRLINLKMAYLLHYDQKNAINNMPEIVPEKTLVSTENDGDLKSNNEEESRDVFKLVETEEDKNNLNIIITSYRWRIDIIRQAFLYGLGSPIIGQGFGKYPDYYIFNQPVKLKTNSPAADSGGVPSHNHLITVFYKMGIIGLLLFLMLNWFVLKGGMKVLPVLQGERWILEGLLSAMIFWHTLALFFDIIDSPTTNIFLWVMIGGILFFLVPRQQIMERNSA
jgi:O-antigen ligase